MTKRELIEQLEALSVTDNTHIDLEVEFYNEDEEDTETHRKPLTEVSVDDRFKTPVIRLFGKI